MRKQVKVNAICYAQMLKFMETGDLTCKELAEETGLHKTTVYQYARDLHAVGIVHIARYEPDANGRHNIKVYKLGKGKDAVRFQLPNAERSRRRRAKLKVLKNPLFRMGETHGQPADCAA